MTEPHPHQSQQGPGEQSVENARVGYSAAISIWCYEGTLIWSRFTSMIYANTILLATLGIVLTSNRARDFEPFCVLLCVLGLVLCVCWYAMNKRGVLAFDYWSRTARELETKYLSPVSNMAHGASFFHLQVDKVTAPVDSHKVALAGLAKWRVRTVANAVILIFALIYVFAVYLTVA